MNYLLAVALFFNLINVYINGFDLWKALAVGILGFVLYDRVKSGKK